MAYLKEYIETLEDGCINLPNCDFSIIIDEGAKHLQETLKFLKTFKGGLKPLEFNSDLNSAAQDHFRDIAPKGLTTHFSSDGVSTYKERIEKYCSWGG